MTSEKSRWSEVLKGDFSGLSLAQAWEVLNAPGIADQPQAKALRYDFGTACIVGLRELEIKGQFGNGKPSALRTACENLHGVIDAEKLGANVLNVSADPLSLQSPEWDALHINQTNLNAAGKEQIRSLASRALSQTDDPWLARDGVTALWDLKSPEILPDWSEIDALGRFMGGRMRGIIATDMACVSIGGCGAANSWTLQYCHLMPATQCPVGASFDQIIALNLSQPELDLRQKILANLYARYPH